MNKQRVVAGIAVLWTAAALGACTVYRTDHAYTPADSTGTYDRSDPRLNAPPPSPYPPSLPPDYHGRPQRPDYDPALDQNGNLVGYCFRPDVPVLEKTRRNKAGPFETYQTEPMCRNPHTGKLKRPVDIIPQTPPFR